MNIKGLLPIQIAPRFKWLPHLNLLRGAYGLKKVVVSTYQAVSGAGAAAIDEMKDQTKCNLK